MPEAREDCVPIDKSNIVSMLEDRKARLLDWQTTEAKVVANGLNTADNLTAYGIELHVRALAKAAGYAAEAQICTRLLNKIDGVTVAQLHDYVTLKAFNLGATIGAGVGPSHQIDQALTLEATRLEFKVYEEVAELCRVIRDQEVQS